MDNSNDRLVKIFERWAKDKNELEREPTVAQLEEEIDRMVYDLYGLTEEVTPHKTQSKMKLQFKGNKIVLKDKIWPSYLASGEIGRISVGDRTFD